MNKIFKMLLSMQNPQLVSFNDDAYLKLIDLKSIGLNNPRTIFSGVASRHSLNQSGSMLSPALLLMLRKIEETKPPLDSIIQNTCAIGISKNGNTIVEYTYDTGYAGVDYEKCTDLVSYNPQKGFIAACTVKTDSYEDYTLSPDASNGVAVLMSLYPHLSIDEEWDNVSKGMESALIDPKKADMDFLKAASILTSNIEARIDNEEIKVPSTILPLKEFEVISMEIAEELFGTFRFWGRENANNIPIINSTELNGKFAIDGEIQEGAETINEDYVVPEDIIEIAIDVKDTAHNKKKINTFLFEGPAGSGKSEGVRALAAALGKRYRAFSCCSDTSALDILGSFVPNTEKKKELPEIPTFGDMKYDPEGSYKKLTGKELNGKTTIDELFELAVRKISEAVASNKDFDFIPSPILESLEANEVCEIQEADHIVIPNTLTILNNIIEGGSVMAPNGKYYKRGETSVLVFTINKDYVENRPLATSIKSRCNETIVMDTPSVDVLTERAMARTGCQDEAFVRTLAEKIHDINEFLKDQQITDGSCGFRELIDWISCSMNSSDPLNKAFSKVRNCVINSATSDDDARETIITTFFEGMYV